MTAEAAPPIPPSAVSLAGLRSAFAPARVRSAVARIRSAVARWVAVLFLGALGCGGETPGERVGTEASASPEALGSARPGSEEGADGGHPVDTLFAETDDGARLWVEVVGEGAPIVVVHGGPGMDSRYLRAGLTSLAEFGRVAFYDQRATGRSEGVETERLDFDTFVDDIDAVRRALDSERVTVLGHSFGGLLALEYVRRQPERVAGLVLVDSAEPGTLYAQAANTRREARIQTEDAELLEELAASGALSRGDTAAFRRFYEAAFRPTFADPARIVELDLTMQPATARNGLRVIRGVGGTADLRDGWARLSSIEVPALVVQGAEDLLPPEMAQALADSLPRGRAALVPGAGHFPWVERPTEFFAALREWEGWNR